MYVDEAWRPSGEPPREPRPTQRQERVFLWLIAVNALLLLIAPVAGATISPGQRAGCEALRLAG